MRLGIIGLPQSGKTTVFNALTRGDQPTTVSGGRFEVHTGVVDVPDERVDRLSAMFRPQKTIYAKVTYADIAGLEGAADKSGISGPLLNQLTQMDGFVHVVRCFENLNAPHPAGSIDPLRDINNMDNELLLNDLISVERKQERLAEERKKGGGRDRAVIERELALFEKLHTALAAEKPLRDIDLGPEEEKLLSGFGFLTRKPVLILLNLSEGQLPPAIDYPRRRSVVAPLQGKLEMELAQLPPDEAEMFMGEYGIEELGLQRVIRLSYDLLGLQSFFTVGEDEVRAWTIQRGTPAVEAAGAIHSDLQKGFIRAEVVRYDDLINLGGMAEARQKGKLRLEGKDYIVQDGEIMHIRFNLQMGTPPAATQLPIDQVLQGDCIDILAALPAESIDLIFADPPYNLQLHQELWRPNLTRVNAVDDAWDHFEDFQAYDRFTLQWLAACRRVLKRSGTIWVIGSYHNIFRVGSRMQDLGFWILNDIVWIKDNPMPNFRGVRFTNAHEMLVWAQKERGAPYTFNHHAMKALNEDLQMRSDWYLPICTGPERLRLNGEKAHSTQKPEALLYRVILASSKPGDVILDPFFGSGTTGAAAKRLHRRWIGIERQAEYVDLARERIEQLQPATSEAEFYSLHNPRKLPRIPFGMLLEYGLLQPSQSLYLATDADVVARIQSDGSLECQGRRGSIHQLARQFTNSANVPCNGWQQWFFLDPQTGERRPINDLREQLRALLMISTTTENDTEQYGENSKDE